MNQTMHPESEQIQETLRELLVYQKKELRHTRFVFMVNLILTLLLAITLAVVVPHVLKLVNEADATLSEVNVLVDDANEMVGQAQVLIENANTMVTENTEAVTETVQKLNAVDFDSLNEAIRNLNDATAPLANFARKFQ